MLTSLPASAPRYDYSEWVRVYARYLDEQLDVYVKTSFFQVEVPRRLDPKGPGCSLLRAALGRCFAASVAKAGLVLALPAGAERCCCRRMGCRCQHADGKPYPACNSERRSPVVCHCSHTDLRPASHDAQIFKHLTTCNISAYAAWSSLQWEYGREQWGSGRRIPLTYSSEHI